MTAEQLKKRTKLFGLHVIRLVETFPQTQTFTVIGRQLLRCATSVGANYRAACRARSKADFIAKSGIAEEEADESVYWLEMLVEATIVNPSRITKLLAGANELTAIMASSRITAKKNK